MTQKRSETRETRVTSVPKVQERTECEDSARHPYSSSDATNCEASFSNRSRL